MVLGGSTKGVRRHYMGSSDELLREGFWDTRQIFHITTYERNLGDTQEKDVKINSLMA
jgi:hypothetical protein